jgi:hypothetical protein
MKIRKENYCAVQNYEILELVGRLRGDFPPPLPPPPPLFFPLLSFLFFFLFVVPALLPLAPAAFLGPNFVWLPVPVSPRRPANHLH